MEMNVKHLLLRKTDILKTSIFSNKRCTNFEEQKGTRYIRGNVYISIFLSLENPCSFFACERKDF